MTTAAPPEPRELLARSRIFEDLARDELDELGRVMVKRYVMKDEPLFVQGATGDSMAVVAEGCFRVEVSRPGHDPETISQIEVGDLVGEMTCLEPAPRSASVVAEEDSFVYQLDGPAMRALKSDNRALFSAVLTGVSARVTDRIRATDEQIDELIEAHMRAGGVVGSIAPTLRAHADSDTPDPRGVRHVPMLHVFTDEELEDLLAVSPRRHCATGELLCREGEPGASCFIVLSGGLEVLREVGEAQRRLATLAEGCVAGQLSLLDFSPRTASLRVSGNTEIIEVTRQTYLDLLAQQSQIAMRLQEQLVLAGIRQLRAATGMLVRLTSLSGHLYPLHDPTRPAGAGPRPRGLAKTPPPSPSLAAAGAPLATPARFPAADPSPATTPAPPHAAAPSSQPSVPAGPHDEQGAASEPDELRQTDLDPITEMDPEQFRQTTLDDFRITMDFLKTALGEWGVSIDDLDAIEESQRE